MSSIAVCVATCNRPQGLARLLESLGELRFRHHATPDIRIVVIDNDASGSAAAVVDSIREDFRWPIAYAIESRRGIPFARNKAVALAANVDYLAFVDDDETVSPSWLDELLAVCLQFGFGIVRGPVVPIFEPGTAAWIIKGGFYERERYRTGQKVRFGATGNILVKRDLLQHIDGPFDEGFGLTGAEDTHLFERLKSLGATIVWANKAIVHESIPVSRSTTGWILRRAYRAGNSWVLCRRSLEVPKFWTVASAGKGFIRIVQGLLLLLLGLFRGRAAIVGALVIACRGAGMISGFFGHRFEEYKTIHGN